MRIFGSETKPENFKSNSMNTLQNTAGKMTNYRWTICAMLFFATTINYLDRQVLSLTWDEFIKPEFHWDESHYGIITSVFSIVYAICMLLPVGLSTGWVLRKAISGLSVYGR